MLDLSLVLPDFIVLLDDHIFVGGFVAGRVGVGIEGHVHRDGVPRDKAGQGTDLGKQTHLVHLNIIFLYFILDFLFIRKYNSNFPQLDNNSHKNKLHGQK